MSVNKVILVGYVGQEPEIREFNGDVKVANFSLATTERGYKKQDGTEVPDKTEWHNIVAWRGLATLSEKYIHKGTQIYVEGKITTETWEKDGIKHYATKIVANTIQLLGKVEKQEQRQSQSVPAPIPQPTQEQEDDLPF